MTISRSRIYNFDTAVPHIDTVLDAAAFLEEETMLLAVKILLTIVTLGYSLIPALADLNKTHATNPRWTGHARFHCVWQVVSYIILAIAMLAIIWFPILPERPQLILPLVAAVAVYGGFFAAVLGKRFYAGENYDENGYLPVGGPLGLALDVNITIFTTMVAFVAVTAFLVSQLVTAAV
ncbi:hypothetical protein [Rhizobium sp. OAE497]|uniref:hypothetical protein n=2 Tax=unclassified Rhizobium TaxID=2613769 RepID=UPI0018F51B98